MSGKFEPDKFEDRYEQAMIAFITKQGGATSTMPSAGMRCNSLA